METSIPIAPSLPDEIALPNAIDGISQPVIRRYFETMNLGKFLETSQLFAADGVMQPPFESPIVGPDAIAAYLVAEAQGFLLHPKQGTETWLEDGNSEIQVLGTVQTSLFSVNVSWRFILTPEGTIAFVKVKLLASAKELLKLRDSAN